MRYGHLRFWEAAFLTWRRKEFKDERMFPSLFRWESCHVFACFLVEMSPVWVIFLQQLYVEKSGIKSFSCSPFCGKARP